MTMAALVWLALAPLQATDKPEPAKPSILPPSPAFHEPGARLVPGETLFQGMRGQNIWVDFNPKGRRVIVRGYVCLRTGQLEEFLCRKGTKEHESIVAADIHPRLLHAALLAAGAESGSVAQFEPKFLPATGELIEVSVEWSESGKTKRLRAQEWIRDFHSGKPLAADWVFAGSQELEDPITKQKYYLANDGDVISVSNFASSLIDLALESSNANAEHLFEAFTERIPPEQTELFVILKPVPPKKAAEPAAGPTSPPGDLKKR